MQRLAFNTLNKFNNNYIESNRIDAFRINIILK
jgi:hypothetical protein